MSNEYVHFNNNTQPAVNEDNLNLMQQLIKNDINGAVSGDTLPIGAIIPYTGTTAPTNWLICDGSAISRTTYQDLFNIIGTTFGSGDGSTTFNLPDMRSRTAVGVDTRDSNLNAVGKTYGEKNHTLTKNELPTNIIDTANTGSNTDGYIARAGYTKTGSYNFGGAGQPFNIMQPSMATNYIIKAFQTAGVVAQVVNQHSTSTTNVYSANYINDLNSYSTTETRIGTWMRRPLYRKVINFGILPNATSKSVSTGMTSGSYVCVGIYGIALPTSIGNYTALTLPDISDSNYIRVYHSGTSNEIIIDTNVDRTNLYGYVTILYTKATY